MKLQTEIGGPAYQYSTKEEETREREGLELPRAVSLPKAAGLGSQGQQAVVRVTSRNSEMSGDAELSSNPLVSFFAFPIPQLANPQN